MSISLKKKPLSNSLRHACLINKNLLWQGKCIKKISFINNVVNKRSTKKKHLRTKGSRLVTRRQRVTTYINSLAGVPSIVVRFEYNPNRSCFLALVLFRNGILCYLNAVSGMVVGETFGTYITAVKSLTFFLKSGDTASLSLMSEGGIISNIERYPGMGPVYVRSAGTYGQLISKSSKMSQIKLPTGQVINVSSYSKASIGTNLNNYHSGVVFGKAGRARWHGIRQMVRGVAMNPVDHPHGGGEGKKGKKSDPVNYWGKVFKWRKTSTFLSNRL